jgi:hypothetical protein
VIHSLRRTMFTRLGESGAVVFKIRRIADHGGLTTLQRYVHPNRENGSGAPTISTTVSKQAKYENNKRWALSSAVRAADS